jgi:hypothetical protein
MTPWTYGAGLAVWILAAVGLYVAYYLVCLAIWRWRYTRDAKRQKR